MPLFKLLVLVALFKHPKPNNYYNTHHVQTNDDQCTNAPEPKRTFETAKSAGYQLLFAPVESRGHIAAKAHQLPAWVQIQRPEHQINHADGWSEAFHAAHVAKSCAQRHKRQTAQYHQNTKNDAEHGEQLAPTAGFQQKSTALFVNAGIENRVLRSRFHR